MDSTPQFRADLYRGTAADYDRYRVPYPPHLIDHLVTRAELSGAGRLLDLACGPGRVTFALSEHFGDIVAIDQEEESVNYAKALADERGASHITWLTGRAEDLDVGGCFELVTVGDAFHRLDRPCVAALVNQWLQPGGHVALLWSSMPWQGSAPWQQAALKAIVHWMEVTGSLRNVPSNLADTLTTDPHLAVLVRAGLAVVGSYEFTASRTWSVETLTGFAHSTSILSRTALGDHAEAFERDLRKRLLAVQPDGNLKESVCFTYDLAVKPAPHT